MPLKNRNVIIALAALVLVGVIFYAYWSLVYTPARMAIATEQKAVDDLNGKLALAKTRAGQLSKIQAEMASLQVDVALLEKQLPKNRELPSLLRILTHRAESFGLAFSTLSPQKAVSKGLYDEIPFSVSLSASFHSLGRFLTAMGKGERLFAARNLAMTAGGGKADPSKTINATFTLVAFKYHD